MARIDRTDRPTSPRARRGMAPDIPNTAPLRPTAAPTDTFVQPRAAPRSNTFLQIAEALGTINPAVNNYLAGELDRRREESAVAAESAIAGMTLEEAKQAREEGTLDQWDDPFFRSAFNYRYGERVGIFRANERLNAYQNNFDRDRGDIEAFVTENVEEDLEGGDEHYQRGYLSRLGPFADRLRLQNAEHRSERMNQETRAGVFETFLQTAMDNLQMGAEPAQIAQAIRAQYEGNADLLDVPRREQDEVLVDVAARLAEDGHASLVDELLFDDRGGVGAIGNTRNHAGRAADISARAHRIARENNRERTQGTRLDFFDQARAGALNRLELDAFFQNNPGALREAEYRSLVARNERVVAELRDERQRELEQEVLDQAYDQSRERVLMQNLAAAEQGMASMIRPREVFNRSGDLTTLSVEQQEDQLVQSYLQRSQLAAQRSGETPEQTFNREVDWFSRNGLRNPQWRQVLMRGYQSATPATMTSENIPPAMEQGLELFRQLHAKNPSLLRNHVTNNDAYMFYDAVQVGMEFTGLDQQTAIAQAFRALREPENMDSVLMRRRYEDIREAVSSLDSSYFDGWGEVENVNDIGPQMERIARYYSLVAGMDSETSLQRAADLIKTTHSYINGRAVYTADQRIGNREQFVDSVERFLERFAEQNEDLGYDPSELTIRPQGNEFGSWVIANSVTGDRVEGWRQNIITLDRLDQFRREERQRELQRIEEEQANRLDPTIATDIPVEITIGPMRWPWQDPYTEEELEEIQRRGDEIRRNRQRRRQEILELRDRENEFQFGPPPHSAR